MSTTMKQVGKGCTVGRMTMKSTCRVLGHSFLQSLVRFALRLIIRLLAHSLSRSGAHGRAISVFELIASISCSFRPLGCWRFWVGFYSHIVSVSESLVEVSSIVPWLRERYNIYVACALVQHCCSLLWSRFTSGWVLEAEAVGCGNCFQMGIATSKISTFPFAPQSSSLPSSTRWCSLRASRCAGRPRTRHDGRDSVWSVRPNVSSGQLRVRSVWRRQQLGQRPLHRRRRNGRLSPRCRQERSRIVRLPAGQWSSL